MPVTSSSSSSLQPALHPVSFCCPPAREEGNYEAKCSSLAFCLTFGALLPLFVFSVWKNNGQLTSVFQKSETRRESKRERERKREEQNSNKWNGNAKTGLIAFDRQSDGHGRSWVLTLPAQRETERERESKKEGEQERERLGELENGMEKWFISLYRSFDRSIGAICGSLFRRLITKIKSFSQITDYLLHLPQHQRGASDIPPLPLLWDSLESCVCEAKKNRIDNETKPVSFALLSFIHIDRLSAIFGRLFMATRRESRRGSRRGSWYHCEIGSRDFTT